MEEWVLILTLLVFLGFVATVGSMAGQTIIKNIPNPPEAPGSPPPFDIFHIGDWITYIWNNIKYFVLLMSISTEFTILGIITGAIIITLLWIIITKLIELIPKIIPLPL